MKYKILGPRLLVKVKKYTKKEETFEGTSILMVEDTVDKEQSAQTIGEVVQIGPTLKSTYEGFEELSVGDKVHFQRYGAQRINVDKHSDCEYWVINGKDALVIEYEA